MLFLALDVAGLVLVDPGFPLPVPSPILVLPLDHSNLDRICSLIGSAPTGVVAWQPVRGRGRVWTRGRGWCWGVWEAN